jgi:hypothetical protein
MTQICTIEGCQSRANARGLCAKHYMRARRHGDPTMVKLPGAPLKLRKAKLREIMAPQHMSVRTFDRFHRAIEILRRLGPDAQRVCWAAAARPGGRLNVSKLHALAREAEFLSQLKANPNLLDEKD